MRKKRFSNILPLLLVLGLAAATSATTSSTNYSLKASVLSSGGTTMDSASYQMTTTIGQSSAIGQYSSSNYINYAGFWQPTRLRIEGKAMPWIPLLLLED